MTKPHFPYVDFCSVCRKLLQEEEQIFYVEDATGNYFCSEDCIRKFYDPVAEYYQTRHLSQRNPHDIPFQEFERYKKYEPLCLQSPDEIWTDETKHGEILYFYLAKFTNEAGTFHYVIMCYRLDKQPTYILLSFPTRDERLLNDYRVGQKIDEMEEMVEESVEPDPAGGVGEKNLESQSFALEEEMFKHRKESDIPKTDFDDFSYLLEETIQNPDEAWEIASENENTVLNLISQFEEQLYYVVICSLETSGEMGDSWRVLYHFPTRDSSLAQEYRRGDLREGPVVRPTLMH